MTSMRFEPTRGLSGELRAPPDESISHRAALLGAMAPEPVRIEHYLQAADTLATLEAVRALGALVELRGEEVLVRGMGLLAALAADGATTVGEPARSRDHTERMLLRAGAGIHRNGRHVTVVNADELALERVSVPGDASSAAFMVVAGVLVPGSRLLISDVGVNWTRTGFLRILRRMRGIVVGDLEDETGELAPQEPVSDLDVAHGVLEGTAVEPE